MEAILMSGRERKRLVVMAQVRLGKVKLRAAGDLLGVSRKRSLAGPRRSWECDGFWRGVRRRRVAWSG